MKRLLFYTLIFVSGISFAQSTLPVIPFGERKADLYYWDTNWYDRYEQLYPNAAVYPGMKQTNYPTDVGNYFLGRACIAEVPILVRGIAGAAAIYRRNNYMVTIDTTLSGRLPEWFKMYDVNFNILGEGRWDTVTPTYRMELRHQYGRDTMKMYEVYFDKPILVSGLFYVGGTALNNLRVGYSANGEDPNDGYEKFQHLFTHYFGYHGTINSIGPSNTYRKCPPGAADVVVYRYLWPYLTAYTNYATAIFDTTTFVIDGGYCMFYPFFAIIDTDYVYYDCVRPTGLGVIEADVDSVVIAWDSSEAETFDVLVWPDGIVPDSGTYFSVDTNRLTLYGLDTALHYNVKVMAVCDTFHINTSQWSNVFGFHIPDYIVWPCAVPEGLRVQQLLTAGSVVVRWDYSDVGEWELAVWGDGDSDAMMLQSQVEYVELVELDTMRWYNACLRAVCDSTNISEWSDTVRFFVPNPNPGGGTETIVDAIGRYTHLMPNPTSDRVTVFSSYQLRKVELFGSDGKRIATFNANGSSTTLNLSTYPAGTYILRITTSVGITTKRMVKK